MIFHALAMALSSISVGDTFAYGNSIMDESAGELAGSNILRQSRTTYSVGNICHRSQAKRRKIARRNNRRVGSI